MARLRRSDPVHPAEIRILAAMLALRDPDTHLVSSPLAILGRAAEYRSPTMAACRALNGLTRHGEQVYPGLVARGLVEPIVKDTRHPPFGETSPTVYAVPDPPHDLIALLARLPIIAGRGSRRRAGPPSAIAAIALLGPSGMAAGNARNPHLCGLSANRANSLLLTPPLSILLDSYAETQQQELGSAIERIARAIPDLRWTDHVLESFLTYCDRNGIAMADAVLRAVLHNPAVANRGAVFVYALRGNYAPEQVEDFKRPRAERVHLDPNSEAGRRAYADDLPRYEQEADDD